MMYKSFHSCRFVHYAKLPSIMTKLNKFLKIVFEGGRKTGKETKNISHTISIYRNCIISFFLIKKFFFFILYDTQNFMPQ